MGINKSNFNRAILNIKRGGWRVYAVVFMMTVTYLILGILLLVIYTSQSLANYFMQKPEVVGFFKDDVTEEQILSVKRELEAQDYVLEIRYVSKEEAMSNFLEDNKDKKDIIEAVTVNVFPAHLNVKATSLDNIPQVADFFRTSDLISDVSAFEDILVTLKKIVLGIQIISLTLLAVFTISTVFIIFLTIGITVYSKKDEIIIMKLVGATNFYVRLPYILEGIIYSFMSVVIASLILVPLALFKYKSLLSVILGDLQVVDMNWLILCIGVGIELLFGVLLAVLSSYFATRRYIDY